MFAPWFTPRGGHSIVKKNGGANREFYLQGITSSLGDKIHPWGTTSPNKKNMRAVLKSSSS
jgi:hypothetical protein